MQPKYPQSDTISQALYPSLDTISQAAIEDVPVQVRDIVFTQKSASLTDVQNINAFFSVCCVCGLQQCECEDYQGSLSARWIVC